ncbi:hypothetical protein GCM10029963_05490 [Micromonospora andamanensis]
MWGVDLPMRDVMRLATVAGLSVLIDELRDATGEPRPAGWDTAEDFEEGAV